MVEMKEQDIYNDFEVQFEVLHIPVESFLTKPFDILFKALQGLFMMTFSIVQH